MPEKIGDDLLLEATAGWTAAVRALESARPDRLFDDPWARALAGEDGAAWAAQRSPDRLISIVLRTRFFDDFLQRVAREHAIRQIVLLAAGLDTRAYRLAWPPQTRLFELDRPAVLRHKAEILRAAGARPACEPRAVEIDLAEPWREPLLAAGLDPRQPAIWLLEGFLFYLAGEQIARLIDEVSSLAAPGSWIGFDVVNGATLTSPYTRQWVEMQAASGAPWIGTLDAPAAFLAERGWRATVTPIGATGANYGRWPFPPIPDDMPNMPRHWFVTATRGESVTR